MVKLSSSSSRRVHIFRDRDKRSFPPPAKGVDSRLTLYFRALFSNRFFH